MHWDLKELRQAVKQLYGQEQILKLSPCLDSIEERLEFARFHFSESKIELKKCLHNKTTQQSLLHLFLAIDAEDYKKFEQCKFKSKAHILSCLQNMHSIYDILSHVIYYSLDMNTAKNKEKIINIHNVKKWVHEIQKYQVLSDKLVSLVKHEEFEYLNAIVNHSKHRSIIPALLNLNLRKESKEIQELKFETFVYNEKSYTGRPVYDFLTSEYERQSSLVIEIGNELNRIVLNFLIK